MIHILRKRRIVHLIALIYQLFNDRITCSDLLAKINLHVPRMTARHGRIFLVPVARTNVLNQAPLSQMNMVLI